ncbi:MAG TPA: hypothetical protein V6C97_17030 [Oculatellaceae cyanobacterium]
MSTEVAVVGDAIVLGPNQILVFGDLHYRTFGIGGLERLAAQDDFVVVTIEPGEEIPFSNHDARIRRMQESRANPVRLEN